MKRLLVLLAIAALAAPAMAAGDAARGAAKAKQSCAACHGADGNTPLTPESPRLAGQYADYLYKTLRDYKSGARRNAVMSSQAAGLTLQEMQDLAAYYAGLPGTLRVVR